MSSSDRHGPATRLIHTGERPPAAASLTVPIYETSTFVFDSAADVEAYAAGTRPAYLYSRYDNPTVVAVETKIAEIDGAEASLVFASGMAAISTAIFGLLEAGDEVVCCAAIYGGTFHVLTSLASRFGVTTRFASLEEFRTPARLAGPKTKMVWFESPINPTLRCHRHPRGGDGLPRARRALGDRQHVRERRSTSRCCRSASTSRCRAHQVPERAQRRHGGVRRGPAGLIGRLAKARRLLGGILDPQPAFLLGRGMKTVTLRVAKHNATAHGGGRGAARATARRRGALPGAAVPSRPRDRGGADERLRRHGLHRPRRQLRAAAFRAFDRLQVFQRAASLGGVESLCSLPVLTSQFGLSDEALAQAGVTRGMMRLSIGLEDAAGPDRGPDAGHREREGGRRDERRRQPAPRGPAGAPLFLSRSARAGTRAPGP
jgi:cystathionine beta-lyase/cystathionine gamma-synthase